MCQLNCLVDGGSFIFEKLLMEIMMYNYYT